MWSSFLYVLSCFALLALVPLAAGFGFYVGGNTGLVVGLIFAAFIVTWALCWYVSTP